MAACLHQDTDPVHQRLPLVAPAQTGINVQRYVSNMQGIMELDREVKQKTGLIVDEHPLEMSPQ